MERQTEVLIIGGGPGGLACAAHLARQGLSVTLVERKTQIGPKVCAGGITWHGLLQHLPEELIERSFPAQHIRSRLQRTVLQEDIPMIATVDRERLGQWMASQAAEAGAQIHTGYTCRELNAGQATLDHADGRSTTIQFDHLVGADGSNSMVRRFLGLSAENTGLGLAAMVPGQADEMRWQMLSALRTMGYAWVFPHRQTVSLGVYNACSGGWSRTRSAPAQLLQRTLLQFAGDQGFKLPSTAIRAGLINFDYQGWHFGRTWLVGDAAGLASAITGEGIYPALVSGQAVARRILEPKASVPELERLIEKHRQHYQIFILTRRFPLLGAALSEVLLVLLRLRLLSYAKLELADRT